MADIQRIGNVFYRVPDMDAAVDFYTTVLGLKLKLRDGDHWAAFDVGGSTLAVEGGAPGGPGGATVSLRVDDLDALVVELRAARAARQTERSRGQRADPLRSALASPASATHHDGQLLDHFVAPHAEQHLGEVRHRAGVIGHETQTAANLERVTVDAEYPVLLRQALEDQSVLQILAEAGHGLDAVRSAIEGERLAAGVQHGALN
jgi:catechol 2,3-dioxygenase-like lactoylglutathione lyase family enzyme